MSETDLPLGDAAFRRTELKGSGIEPTYAGVHSFMRRKFSRDLSGVDIAVTGIPFDQSVTNRPGTRFGPEGVRKASSQNSWGPHWPWMFDPFDTLNVVDYGDCYFDWGRNQDVPQAIEDHISEIITGGASSLVIGGDHFISYPVIKAHAKAHGGPLSLIQFDAHRDVEPEDGDRIDHGTMFNRAIQDGVIDPHSSIQIGIRTTYTGEHTYGMKILYADQVQELSASEIASEIEATVGRRKAYLTFDIDCLDPAYAPGTGTPVPGGLTSYQALSILRKMTAIDYAGMDVVEVSPPYDHAQTTSLIAAMIALEYLCIRAWQAGARGTAVPE